MKGRYLMQRHDGFNQLVIDEAFKADDYQTVIEAYLDTLDYTKDLQDSAFVKVLESSSFAEAIDHVLFGHVKDNMDARNLDSRLQMSVYYFNIKGGLTSCDLINALAADDTIESVIESRLFKEDLVAKVLNEDYHLDGFVREKLMEALNNLRPKLNAEFYGLPDVAVAEEAATPAAEEVQAEAPKEQIESKQEESA
jgi:nitric oxide reductase activation protein